MTAGANQASLFNPRPRVDGARIARQRAKANAHEREMHIAIADLLYRCARKDWSWTHFPAGELRTLKTGHLLKRMGLKPGWPDLIFIAPSGRPYFLELKSAEGELTDAQLEVAASMRAKGIEVKVARSVGQAIKVLAAWGIVPVSTREPT